MKRIAYLFLMILFLVPPVFPADNVLVFTNQDVERFNDSSRQNNNSSKSDKIANSEGVTSQELGLKEKSAQTSDGIDEAEKKQIEGLVIQVWSSMTNKLRSGDIEGALDYFVPQSRDRYRQIFTKMGATPVTSILEIRFKTSYGPIVECLAIRQEKEGKFAYPVSFVKEDSGDLKIFGF